MSDQNTRDARRQDIKVRKQAKHYGQNGGAHRTKKGGGYRRETNVRWETRGEHA